MFSLVFYLFGFGTLIMAADQRNTVYLPYMMSGQPDPLRIIWSGDWVTSQHIWATLVDLDQKGQPRPCLASKWQRSVDGRTWQFTLAPNLRWSNGNPITTEQVIESLKTSAKGTAHTYLSEVIKAIVATEGKVEFQLKKPIASFLISLSYVDWAIVHPSSLKSGSDSPQVEKATPSSGPFVLIPQEGKQSEIVEEIHFRENPHTHVQPGLPLKEGKLSYFDDCATLIKNAPSILSFRAYHDQLTPACRKVLEQDFVLFESQPSWTLKADFTKRGRSHFPLEERYALTLLVHDQLTSKEPSFGIGPATGILPPHLKGSLPVEEYNKVIKHIRKKTTGAMPKGKKLSLVTMSLWAQWKSFQWLKETLLAAGMTVEETVLDRTTFFNKMEDQSLEDEYDLVHIPMGVGDPDPDGTWQTIGKWSYPGLIDMNLVHQAYFEANIEKKSAIYRQLGERVLLDGIALFLRYQSDYIGYHKSLNIADTAPFRAGTTLYDLIPKTR